MKTKRGARALRLGGLLTVLLVAGGCAKDDPNASDTAEAYGKAVEQAEDVVDAAANRMSEASRQVEGRAGAVVPERFPIFPGAVPNAEVPGTDEFRWDTATPIPEVGDYYEAELGKAPWAVFQSMRASTKAQVLVFTNAGERVPAGRVSLKPGPNGEGTTILLHLE